MSNTFRYFFNTLPVSKKKTPNKQYKPHQTNTQQQQNTTKKPQLKYYGVSR